MAAELVETSRLWARTVARDRPGVGRAARRAPGQAHLLRAALVAQAGGGDGRRAGHAVRRPARRRPARDLRPVDRRWPASCSSATRWSRATGRPATASSPHNRAAARGGRGAREPGPPPRHRRRRGHAVRLLRRAGRAPTSSPGRTSTPGGSRPGSRSPDLLTFDPAMLLHEGAADVSAEDFPDAWQEGAVPLPLTYAVRAGRRRRRRHRRRPAGRAQPGQRRPLTWQVPGLREELVTALLRSLPKQLRVSFVPAPDHARDFLAAVPPGPEPLLDALERDLRARTGVHVPRRRVGLEQGARPPAADLPGRRRRRARGLARARTWPRSRSRSAPGSPTRCSRRRPSAPRSGARDWDFGTVEPLLRGDPGRPAGAGLPGAGRRGRLGRAAGLRRRGRPRPRRTGSAYDGCWR